MSSVGVGCGLGSQCYLAAPFAVGAWADAHYRASAHSSQSYIGASDAAHRSTLCGVLRRNIALPDHTLTSLCFTGISVGVTSINPCVGWVRGVSRAGRWSGKIEVWRAATLRYCSGTEREDGWDNAASAAPAVWERARDETARAQPTLLRHTKT